MPEEALGNLFSWIVQGILLVSVGAVLPVLFRVRHPRAQLAWCHVVLALPFLLPVIQPWRHMVVTRQQPVSNAKSPGGSHDSIRPPVAAAETPVRRDNDGATTPPVGPRIPSRRLPGNGELFLCLLAGGAAVRLWWILAGLWRIRQYRIASTPLYPIPESIHAAAAITHSNAVFCISDQVPGPVMLGWLAPVVLLPESFLSLGEEAQCGVACWDGPAARESS